MRWEHHDLAEVSKVAALNGVTIGLVGSIAPDSLRLFLCGFLIGYITGYPYGIYNILKKLVSKLGFTSCVHIEEEREEDVGK